MPATTISTRAARSVSLAASSRCRPATPTSTSSSVLLPKRRATLSASAPTGASAVPARDDRDRALPDRRHLGRPEPERARDRLVLAAAEPLAHRVGHLRRDARHEHVLLRVAQRARDVGDLLAASCPARRPPRAGPRAARGACRRARRARPRTAAARAARAPRRCRCRRGARPRAARECARGFTRRLRAWRAALADERATLRDASAGYAGYRLAGACDLSIAAASRAARGTRPARSNSSLSM